jgi:xanthine dehydrogenase molybdopterin-binding subunit B
MSTWNVALRLGMDLVSVDQPRTRARVWFTAVALNYSTVSKAGYEGLGSPEGVLGGELIADDWRGLCKHFRGSQKS